LRLNIEEFCPKPVIWLADCFEGGGCGCAGDPWRLPQTLIVAAQGKLYFHRAYCESRLALPIGGGSAFSGPRLPLSRGPGQKNLAALGLGPAYRVERFRPGRR